MVGSLKSRRTHERVLAPTAALSSVLGLFLEVPPFRFGETEMPGRNEKRLAAKRFAGRCVRCDSMSIEFAYPIVSTGFILPSVLDAASGILRRSGDGVNKAGCCNSHIGAVASVSRSFAGSASCCLRIAQ